MNCAKWAERIALYAGGDAPGDAAMVERHLAECAECREFAAGLRDSLATLREAHGEQLAAGHFTAVRARVLEQLAVQRVPVWRRRWVWGVAAAVLAIVAAAGSWELPGDPPPPPRVVASAIPPAPVIEHVNRPAHPGKRTLHAVKTESLMIRIVTNDPDVVLYWIADKKGDE
jgi:anti-sigma factor RsiW